MPPVVEGPGLEMTSNLPRVPYFDSVFWKGAGSLVVPWVKMGGNVPTLGLLLLNL